MVGFNEIRAVSTEINDIICSYVLKKYKKADSNTCITKGLEDLEVECINNKTKLAKQRKAFERMGLVYNTLPKFLFTKKDILAYWCCAQFFNLDKDNERTPYVIFNNENKYIKDYLNYMLEYKTMYNEAVKRYNIYKEEVMKKRYIDFYNQLKRNPELEKDIIENLAHIHKVCLDHLLEQNKKIKEKFNELITDGKLVKHAFLKDIFQIYKKKKGGKK